MQERCNSTVGLSPEGSLISFFTWWFYRTGISGEMPRLLALRIPVRCLVNSSDCYIRITFLCTFHVRVLYTL
jgi:hypothetical protein